MPLSDHIETNTFFDFIFCISSKKMKRCGKIVPIKGHDYRGLRSFDSAQRIREFGMIASAGHAYLCTYKALVDWRRRLIRHYKQTLRCNNIRMRALRRRYIWEDTHCINARIEGPPTLVLGPQ